MDNTTVGIILGILVCVIIAVAFFLTAKQTKDKKQILDVLETYAEVDDLLKERISDVISETKTLKQSMVMAVKMEKLGDDKIALIGSDGTKIYRFKIKN